MFCLNKMEGRWNCTAYPEGIPDEIMSNEVDHRYPHEGDRGIQFAPVDDEAAEAAAFLFDREDAEEEPDELKRIRAMTSNHDADLRNRHRPAP